MGGADLECSRNAGQPHTLGERNLLSVRKETLPVCFAPRGQNTNMCYVRSEFIEPPAPSEVIPMGYTHVTHVCLCLLPFPLLVGSLWVSCREKRCLITPTHRYKESQTLLDVLQLKSMVKMNCNELFLPMPDTCTSDHIQSSYRTRNTVATPSIESAVQEITAHSSSFPALNKPATSIIWYR